MHKPYLILFATSVTMLSLILAGCDMSAPKAASIAFPPLPDQSPVGSIEVLEQQFEKAVRLRTANGEFVSVESPGYACPTLADINDDGSLDLIVGQFAGGKMKVYFSNSTSWASGDFANADWINSAGKPAEVPGVS